MPLLLGLIVLAAVACGGDTGHGSPSASLAETTVRHQPSSPPAHNLWINSEGEFWVWEYDDRALSPEEKALDPVINPAWAPFAECMSDRGRAVVDGAPEDLRQQDLDALVVRLNDEYPDRDANRRISSAADTSGLAADFLACADEWLNLDAEQLEDKLR